MKRLCFVILLLLVSSVYAKNNFGIKFGKNFSSFRSMDSKAKAGNMYGAFKDLSIYKNFNIRFELICSYKKGEIYDLILGGTYTGRIFSNNIYYSLCIFEFPILLKNSHPLFSKKINFYYFTGPSFSTRFADGSKTERQEYLFNVNKMEDWANVEYDYDYILEGGPSFEHGWSLHSGFGLSVFHISLEFRYIYDFYEIQTVGKADIDDEEMHSYLILLGYEF